MRVGQDHGSTEKLEQLFGRPRGSLACVFEHRGVEAKLPRALREHDRQRMADLHPFGSEQGTKRNPHPSQTRIDTGAKQSMVPARVDDVAPQRAERLPKLLFDRERSVVFAHLDVCEHIGA